MAAILNKWKFIKLQKQQETGNVIVCPVCKKELNRAEVIINKYVCYECGNYFRVRTSNRIRMVADKESFTPWFEEMEFQNPLDFPEYDQKIQGAREKTGLSEGVTIGEAKIYGESVVLGVCDARFLMGSMGHIVGEKIAEAVEKALQEAGTKPEELDLIISATLSADKVLPSLACEL